MPVKDRIYFGTYGSAALHQILISHKLECRLLCYDFTGVLPRLSPLCVKFTMHAQQVCLSDGHKQLLDQLRLRILQVVSRQHCQLPGSMDGKMQAPTREAVHGQYLADSRSGKATSSYSCCRSPCLLLTTPGAASYVGESPLQFCNALATRRDHAVPRKKMHTCLLVPDLPTSWLRLCSLHMQLLAYALKLYAGADGRRQQTIHDTC